MDTYWLTFLPFVMAALFVLIISWRRTTCPDCGAPLPAIGWPHEMTRRMWLEGGSACHECGCEVDAAGKKVAPGTPPGSAQVRQWAALVVLVAVGVGLGTTILFIGRREAAPPVVAAPVVPPGN